MVILQWRNVVEMFGDQWTREVMYAKYITRRQRGGAFAPPLPPLNPPLFYRYQYH